VYLAEFFTRLGDFEMAADIFEEAIETRVNGVRTVKDFTIVFNSYVKFEQQLMVNGIRLELDADDAGLKDESKSQRLESLLMRRPFLLSEVKLQRNVNDVAEWLNLIELSGQNRDRFPGLTADMYSRAIQEVDPAEAVGKFSEIWISFAHFYEKEEESALTMDPESEGNLENANIVFQKASQVSYRSIDELAAVFCAWAEMHCRHGNLDSAVEILKYACTDRQSKLAHNMKCWQFYIDLLLNQYDLEAEKQPPAATSNTASASNHLDVAEFKVREAYTKCLDLKIITPSMLLNYTSFLQDKCHLFE